MPSSGGRNERVEVGGRNGGKGEEDGQSADQALMTSAAAMRCALAPSLTSTLLLACNALSQHLLWRCHAEAAVRTGAAEDVAAMQGRAFAQGVHVLA